MTLQSFARKGRLSKGQAAVTHRVPTPTPPSSMRGKTDTAETFERGNYPPSSPLG